MEKMGVGVIGAGFMGSRFARVINDMSQAQLVCVMSRTEEGARRLGEQLDCHYTTSLDEITSRDDIQAVIVATPNNAHVEPVVSAARHGKHVFLEKPMALTVSDCDRILEETKRAGVILFLGHTMRFMAGAQAIKRAIEDGAIGQPIVARSLRNTWADIQAFNSWKLRRSMSGGDLFHHIHEIDLLLWFVGDVESVFARTANLAHQHLPEYDDAIFVSMKFKSGALGHMEFGTAFRGPEHNVVVGGTAGVARLDMHTARVSITWGPDEVMTTDLLDDRESNASLIEFFRPKKREDNLVYGTLESAILPFERWLDNEEMAHFINCILEREQPLVDPGEARVGVAIASAAVQSADSGMPVAVGSMLG